MQHPLDNPLNWYALLGIISFVFCMYLSKRMIVNKDSKKKTFSLLCVFFSLITIFWFYII